MKLAILGPLSRNYEEIRLLEEGKKLFDSVSYFPIPQVVIETDGRNSKLTFKNKNLATEMERMCKLGSITPDAWMVSAVGAPISTEPLVKAVQVAVKELNSKQ